MLTSRRARHGRRQWLSFDGTGETHENAHSTGSHM
jgi:hypothetical protein